MKQYFRLEENKLLYLYQDEKKHEVTIVPCFPKSHPEKYLSVRNEKNKEIFLIEDLNLLPQNEQEVLRKILSWYEFSIEIEKVYGIEEDVELRVWNVLTQSGKRTFQTLSEDWPNLVENRLIVRDLSGDLYKIDDLRKLDHKSAKAISHLI